MVLKAVQMTTMQRQEILDGGQQIQFILNIFSTEMRDTIIIEKDISNVLLAMVYLRVFLPTYFKAVKK